MKMTAAGTQTCGGFFMALALTYEKGLVALVCNVVGSIADSWL